MSDLETKVRNIYNISNIKEDIVGASTVLVSNDNYMCWLEEFTKKFPFFSSEIWNYCKDEIREEEKENIQRLGDLFLAVENYASKNHIPADEEDEVISYNIRFNGQVYSIEYDNNFKRYNLDRKDDDEIVDYWIEFSDIQKNEKTERAKKIDSVIERLETVIGELEQEQVDVDSCVVKVLMKREERK